VGVPTRSMTLVCLSTDCSEADSRAGPMCTVNTSLHNCESGTMYLNKRIFNHSMRTCHTSQEARDRAVVPIQPSEKRNRVLCRHLLLWTRLHTLIRYKSLLFVSVQSGWQIRLTINRTNVIKRSSSWPQSKGTRRTNAREVGKVGMKST